MKRKSLFTICTAAAVALSSCTGMLMSTDFGIDDYGPNNWYWSPYNGYYDGPGAWMGPSWNTPPPPRPTPVRPAPTPTPPPSNGANRPNTTPTRPSQSPTNPPASQRPGNMGQAPSQSNTQRPGNTPSQSPASTNTNGSSGTHRGR